MKKVLFLFCFLVFSCLGWAQHTVTIESVNEPLRQVIQMVEDQTGMLFVVNDEVDTQKQVSVNLKKASLSDALNKILTPIGVQYAIQDKHIVLSNKPLQESTFVPGKQLTANGIVLDATGEPAIGATVMVKGTVNGTVTDFDGNFSIDAKEGDILVFSYVGYQTQELRAGESMKIAMREDNELLDEVVVVGYGTQKKVNLTGAVSVIDDKALANRPVPTAAMAIQGADPSLNINMNSGSPDAGCSINIRGVSSLTSGAQPLVLIDGVEGSLNRLNANDIESISILKDASAAAVYGARASAGVVLVTTKSGKEGKFSLTYSGRVGLSQNTTSSDYITTGYWSAKINDMFYKPYMGYGYTNYTEEDYEQLYARINDKTEDPSRPWVTTNPDGTYKYYANFDWYNYLYKKNRLQHEHNLTVQGGTDKINFYVSGRYYHQDGILKIQNDTYDNASMRTKVSAKINNWLKFTNNTSFFYSHRFFPGTSNVPNTLKKSYVHALACVPATNPDGSAVYINNNSNTTATVADGHAAILIYGKHRNNNYDREIKTTNRFDITPIKQLTITAEYTYSYRHREYQNRQVNVPYSEKPGEILWLTTGSELDYYQEQHYRVNDHNLNIFATYEDTFKDNHHLTIMAGGQLENWESKSTKMRKEDLATDDLDAFDLASGDVTVSTGSINDWATLGFFGRVNYDYAGRYLFEFSARGDASSRFSKKNRWGFFPSGSVGWRMSEERWWQPVENVWTNSKLRVSVGSLGNQNIDDYYTYIENMTLNKSLDYLFSNDSRYYYAIEDDPKASDLTWETTTTYDVGWDIGFFRNRLNLTIDGYIRDTKNMLVDGMPLAATYGASVPKSNISDMRTYGWELSIGWEDQVKVCGRPLHYSASFGIGDYTSKVTRFNNPNNIIDRDLTDNENIYYEGQTVGEIWGFEVDGLFASDEEAASYPVDQTLVNQRIIASVGEPGLRAGDVRYVDLDGDGKITTGEGTKDNHGDLKIIGNALPRFSYNFKFGFNWYGVDLSMFFQGIGHQDWYPSQMAYGFWGPYSRPYMSFIPTDFMKNVWSEDNQNAYFPRPRAYEALNSSYSLGAVNSRYLQNIAYFRLKNLTLGYTIPLPENKVVQNMRVYFSGENLFYFSPLKKHTKYVDPEQASAPSSGTEDVNSGIAYNFSRTFSFGLSVTF